MKTAIQKIMIMGVLLVLQISVQARALLIQKDGKVKYVIQDYQLTELKLNDGNTVEGIFIILSDTTLKIGKDTIPVSSVYSVKVDKGSRSGKVSAIFGLVSGTGLIITGASMLSDNTLMILINGPLGLAAIAIGIVIDAVSLNKLASSSEKWIVVSSNYAKYQMSII